MSGEVRLRRDELPAIYERLCEVLAVRLWEEERGRAVFVAAVERVAQRERGLELLDARAVGVWLGIPAKSVGGLVRSGVLASPLMVGKHRRWRRRDVAAFVAEGDPKVRTVDATGTNGPIGRGGGQADTP